MIKSKVHLIPLVSYPYIILWGIGLTITMLCLQILHPEDPIPTGAWTAPIIFGSLGFGTLSMVIRNAKRITIYERSIQIDFVFRRQTYKYHFQDIIGYSTYMNYGRFRDYESFFFKTKDDKIYRLLDYEFRNYKALTDLIKANCRKIEISKYYELKPILIIYLASTIMTVLTIATTLIFT